MPNLYTLGDVVARLKLVMEFFDNDTSKFMIHFGEYLWKNLREYKPQLFLEYHPDQSKQSEEKKEKPKPPTTEMTLSTSVIGDSKTTDLEDMFKTLSTALKTGTLQSLIDLLKSLEGGQNFLRTGGLEEAQRMRRASTLDGISSTIKTGSGKRMSAIEKNSFVVEEALKLAELEQVEDLQMEKEDDDELRDEYKAGDEVIIIEGENCGLFGTLQNSTRGIFGVFDKAIKEDEEGNYGVDVRTASGEDEGYWIHPEAMQLKRYVAGQEVNIIDGLNKGRNGTIQSDGSRIRIDEGSYGVDVKLDDGSVEGFWIYPTSMKPIDSPDKVEEKDEDDDLDEIDRFDFLPYVPYPGDALDEALSDQLNTFEIDINIKRLVAKSGKVVYRYGGKRHHVKFIHGIILVKENGVWTELTPILRNLCGMGKLESDIFHKK